jgi:hypothetical protein
MQKWGYSEAMCDALMMDGIDIGECRVEMLFTDGATWYKAERIVRVEEVEDVLDGRTIVGRWRTQRAQNFLMEYLGPRPAYYGA